MWCDLFEGCVILGKRAGYGFVGYLLASLKINGSIIL